jgi:hypothetical protein
MARLGFVLVGTHAFGCAYRTPSVNVPAGLHAVAPEGFDLAAVTVVSSKADVTLLGTHVPADVAKEVGELLAPSARVRASTAGAAKIRVDVDLGRADDFIEEAGHDDGCGAMGVIIAAPAGATIENDRVAVDVTVEAGGKTLHGHGEAGKDGSVYAHARRRALAVALDRALAQAAGASRPPGSPNY